MNKMIPSLTMALSLSLSLINPTLVTLATATLLAPAAAAEATSAGSGDLARALDKVPGDQAAPLGGQVQPASGEPANLSAPTPTPSPSPVLPGEPTGAAMAHTCAACHGTNGVLGDEYFMPLAGMPVTQFVTTMREFRSGERLATLMGHVASGFSDEEFQAMGEFFAVIAPPPALAATAPGAKP